MMPHTHVAIVNADPDLMAALATAVESLGFETTALSVLEAKNDRGSLRELLRDYDPRVVIFDITPPYDTNWNFLQEVRSWPESAGRRFVVTTTNVRRLHQIVAGAGEVLELVGKPFDLEQLASAVRRAAESDAADHTAI
jgi:DNA-binding NtrC family response regulator